MESQAKERGFARLTIESGLEPGTLIEFIALCAGARVFTDDLIGTRDRKYVVERIDNRLSIAPEKSARDLESDECLLEPAKMLLGAKLLGADVQVDGSWRHRFPQPSFLKANLGVDDMIADAKQPLHELIDLTLFDLEEIHRLLVGQTKTASELLEDKNFRTAFPSIDSRYGMFGGLRHRSGTEIKIDWSETSQIRYHVFEAPSPCERILERWIKSSGLKVDTVDGFRNYRLKKWQLAKMLSRVPQKHKQRVYEWVNAITFDVEEYHSTRGGHHVPETSECEYENSIISVNRNLDFELIEC